MEAVSATKAVADWLFQVYTGAVVLKVVIRTVELTDQSTAPFVRLTTQTGLLLPIVALKVRVTVPAEPGEPDPVERIIVPAWSVEPVWRAHEGLVPPPVENAQVGAVPTVKICALAAVPEIPIVG